MRLLICTQVVDKNDPVLGFFHRWIEEFATHFESIVVICLFEGLHELPPNVTVYSLGKDTKTSPSIVYAIRFVSLIFRLRNDYDRVFVHMNQEYVLLSGFLSQILGKKMSMWRNHYAGSLVTRVAVHLCDVVFSTSRFAYLARFRKNVTMPVGIDTNVFRANQVVSRAPRSILMLGRVDASKRIEILIRALGLLKDAAGLRVTIVGGPSEKSSSYPTLLQDEAKKSGCGDRVAFLPAVANLETVGVYSAHDIYVNMSRSGMLDKTIFEAMACGALVISCSEDLNESPFIVTKPDVGSVAQRLRDIFAMTDFEKDAIREEQRRYVEEHHGLKALAQRLENTLS